MILPSRTIVARSGEVGDLLEKTSTIRMMVKRNMAVSMSCQMISVMIIESLHGKRFITKDQKANKERGRLCVGLSLSNTYYNRDHSRPNLSRDLGAAAHPIKPGPSI